MQYWFASRSLIVMGRNTGVVVASLPGNQRAAGTPNRYSSARRRPCRYRFAWRSYFSMVIGVGWSGLAGSYGVSPLVRARKLVIGVVKTRVSPAASAASGMIGCIARAVRQRGVGVGGRCRGVHERISRGPCRCCGVGEQGPHSFSVFGARTGCRQYELPSLIASLLSQGDAPGRVSDGRVVHLGHVGRSQGRGGYGLVRPDGEVVEEIPDLGVDQRAVQAGAR